MKSEIKEYAVGTIFGDEELDAVRRVLESGVSLTRGPDVELFEKEFAEYCGAKHAVALSSCGAALHIAAQLLNLGPEDEVICQDNSFWVAIVHLLARDVKIKCADICPNSLNIDPEKIEPLITKRTKAIYLLHHGGNPADLNRIRKVAIKYGLKVVEDCAHAVGATYRGEKIGCRSDIACFSFSTLKNMSTLGEGGMIVTNNMSFSEKARGLRTNYPYGKQVKRRTAALGKYPKPASPAFMHAGDAWSYNWLSVSEFGTTFRMSTPQAAVGRIQLKKLNRLISRREKVAIRYNKAIEETEHLRTVKILSNCRHAWQLYTFFLNSDAGFNRDVFVERFKEKYGIEIVIRFWPIHLGGIMRMNGHAVNECPTCEHVWFYEQLSLPISPQMKNREIKTIIRALQETMKSFR